MTASALVVGGTGPTGPFVVQGLCDRAYAVTMLHTGRHERPEVPADVEHVHADPFDRDVVARALGGRTFDVAIVMYGRLRDLAERLAGRVGRLVSIGGGPVVDGFGNPTDLWPPGMPVPSFETAPTVDQGDRAVRNDKVARMVETERAVFSAHPTATHVRYPLIYGPHQLLPREWLVVRRILDGRRRIIVADGGLQLVAAAYVENAAAAVLVCVDQPEATAGSVLHASDETTPTVRQVVQIIAQTLDADVEIVDLPYELARPAYPLLMRGGSFHRYMPPTRLIALGYRDRVPYQEGLARTVRWLAANPLRGDAIERNLQDPFDYAAEDALLAAWDAAVGPLQEAAAAADPFFVDRYSPEREEDRERRRAARRARAEAGMTVPPAQ
jgi:nucleoside-diphosphate-sugar epimerase